MDKQIKEGFVSKETLLREFDYLTMNLDVLDKTLQKKTNEVSLHCYLKHRIEIQKISDQFHFIEEKWKQGKIKRKSIQTILSPNRLSYRSS